MVMTRLFSLLVCLATFCATLLALRVFPRGSPAELASRRLLAWPFALQQNDQAYASTEGSFDATDNIIFTNSDAAPSTHSQGEDSVVPGQFTRKIVAVGDLHGDFPNAHRVLEMAGVVDEHGNWTGAVDFFVQTGDIIDRGDDTIKLYLWMDQLREQAHAVGGQVLSHLGNHEWMNAIGDWRYVEASEIATFGSVKARQKMLSAGRIGRSWAANYTTTSRLPLHPALGVPNTDYDPASAFSRTSPLSHTAVSFVHGGLAPTYPDLAPFPSRINELGRSLLRKIHSHAPPPPHPPNPYTGLPRDATAAEHRMCEGVDGPLWYRGWALESEAKVCDEVDEVLQKTGTRRMVMGHTPDFDKIVSRCNGKIIIIDTGISHAYGGELSALSITYTFAPLSGDDTSPQQKRWREREVVKAVYLDRFETLVDEERELLGDFVLA